MPRTRCSRASARKLTTSPRQPSELGDAARRRQRLAQDHASSLASLVSSVFSALASAFFGALFFGVVASLVGSSPAAFSAASNSSCLLGLGSARRSVPS